MQVEGSQSKNSLNAVNSLEHVETRRQGPDTIPLQIIIVTEKFMERQTGGYFNRCRRKSQAGFSSVT